MDQCIHYERNVCIVDVLGFHHLYIRSNIQHIYHQPQYLYKILCRSLSVIVQVHYRLNQRQVFHRVWLDQKNPTSIK